MSYTGERGLGLLSLQALAYICFARDGSSLKALDLTEGELLMSNSNQANDPMKKDDGDKSQRQSGGSQQHQGHRESSGGQQTGGSSHNEGAKEKAPESGRKGSQSK